MNMGEDELNCKMGGACSARRGTRLSLSFASQPPLND